jgi:hypothetical protein
MGVIYIRVTDEGRGAEERFSCDAATLVAGMRYFAGYLSDVPTGNDLEISVHCEIEVFELLLRFIKSSGEGRPPLAVDNVLQARAPRLPGPPPSPPAVSCC